MGAQVTANPYESLARAAKVARLVRSAETLLSRLGVRDFAAPGLAELVAEWDAPMWTCISRVAGVTACSGAAKGERVCAACRALVVEDFKSRPALMAKITEAM
jgi:hypothetical protein